MFNGSEYLSRTIESLRAQEFEQFRALLIDDHSTDGSFEIICEAARADTRFVAIRTTKNLGSAAAILAAHQSLISSEFFAYSSQDDFFSVDWLRAMVERANETGADAVLPEMIWFYDEDHQDVLNLPPGLTKNDLIAGRDAVAYSLDWSLPGCALWRSEIVHSVGFESFSMNADDFTVRTFFDVCRTVAFSRGTFFYNQGNPEAITKVRGHPRVIGSAYTEYRLGRFLDERGYGTVLAGASYLKSAKLLLRRATYLRANRIDLDAVALEHKSELLNGLKHQPHRTAMHAAAHTRSDLVAHHATTHGPITFNAIVALLAAKQRLDFRAQLRRLVRG